MVFIQLATINHYCSLKHIQPLHDKHLQYFGEEIIALHKQGKGYNKIVKALNSLEMQLKV